MSTNDPRTAQERAEALAEKKFPARLRPNGMEPPPRVRRAFVDGFLARDAEPTTVSAEQIEQAAEGLATQDNRLWTVMGEIDREQYREFARAAFRAAGFRIEGSNE